MGQQQLAMGMDEARVGAEVIEAALDRSDHGAMQEGIERIEQGLTMMSSSMTELCDAGHMEMCGGSMHGHDGHMDMGADDEMSGGGMMCSGMMDGDHDTTAEMMHSSMMQMSEAMDRLRGADDAWDHDRHDARDMAADGLDMFHEGMVMMERSMADAASHASESCR